MSRGLRILVGSGVVMSMSVSSLGVSQSRLEDQERFWRSMSGKHVLEDVIVALMRFLALVIPPSTHFTVNSLLPAGTLRYCSHR